jgi:signal transduction histidine kinase
VTLETSLSPEEVAAQIAQARTRQAELQVDLLRRASLGDVVAGITHQSRNIMTGVLSFSQIACHRNSDPKLEKLLENIHKESSRCVELMNQILTLARSREVHASNVYVRVLLAETISSACRLAEPAMDAREIRLENDISDTDLEVIGDGGALRDLFLNLLRNATEATPDGGSIRVSAEVVNETIRLSFEDSGEGIAPEARDKVFDPGFTTKGAGEGTGLGLAVSKQVALEHKGDIVVDQSSLGGARFLVTLSKAPVQGESQ